MFDWFFKIPLLGQAATIAAIVVILGLTGVLTVKQFEIWSLESSLKDSQKQVGTLTTEKAALTSSLVIQNEAVDTWKKHGEALQVLLDNTIKTNASIAQNSAIRVQQLANAPIPQQCPEAVKWLGTQYNVTAHKWNKRGVK